MDGTVIWKPRKESYKQGLEYMRGRMQGKLKSLKTPWDKFNQSCMDGIEWQSLLIVCGRPGNLKSTVKDNIIQKAFDLNPDQKFRVLDFQFEMIGRVTALREFSSAIGKSYQYLCSSDKQFNEKDLDACYKYAKQKADADKYPVDIIDSPQTVSQFIQIVHAYMDKYKTEELDKEGNTVIVYTKTIVGIDHSLLFAKDGHENSEHEMLANLGKALTMLKKKYPIIFIVLSQLNRNIEHSSRSVEGTQANYIATSDLYGSDSLLMHADLLVALSRPMLSNLHVYGPLKFIINSDLVLVMHWLKTRNGSSSMSFYHCDFSSMSLHEVDPPACVGSNRDRKVALGEPVEPKQSKLQPNNLFTQE